MPSDSPDPFWSDREVTWIYRLGEIPLFRSRFHMLQLNGHFATWIDRTTPAVPRHALRGSLAGALIRSLPVAEPLPAVSVKDGLIRYRVGQASHYWIAMEGTFAEYTRKFSSKTRQTLARKVRRAIGPPVGAVFHAYRTVSEMETFVGLARELSARTYQERLFGAGFPSEPAFHQAILERAAQDLERGFLLIAGAKPIAYLYAPESAPGVLSYHSLGYDPDFEQLSPGTVLQYLALEHLFAEGRQRMFDFGEGETEAKRLFATHHVLCADIYLFRPGPSNVARVGLRLFLESSSATIVWILDRLGVKRLVKRFFRRRAVAPSPG